MEKTQFNHNEYLVDEGGRMMLYKGYPKKSTSTRIDVTMAFNIGLQIGKGNYEGIELLTIKNHEKNKRQMGN